MALDKRDTQQLALWREYNTSIRTIAEIQQRREQDAGMLEHLRYRAAMIMLELLALDEQRKPD